MSVNNLLKQIGPYFYLRNKHNNHDISRYKVPASLKITVADRMNITQSNKKNEIIVNHSDLKIT